jgi:hypothetical protein
MSRFICPNLVEAAQETVGSFWPAGRSELAAYAERAKVKLDNQVGRSGRLDADITIGL